MKKTLILLTVLAFAFNVALADEITTATNTSTTTEVKAPLKERAVSEKEKTAAVKVADKMISQLEQIKSKVSSAKDLTAEDISGITSKIDSEIAKINELKNKINSAQTRAELRSALKEAKMELNKVRAFSKHFAARLLANRINKAIEKIESRLVKVESKIAELKSAGKDVSKLESLVAEAKGHITEAKAKQQEAKAKFQEILGSADANKTAREANVLAKEANKHLILAHKALQGLIPETNKLIKPAKSESEEESTTQTQQ